MIALQKDEAVIIEYYKWYETVKDELNNHFSNYSNKKPSFKLSKRSFTALKKKFVPHDAIIELQELTDKEFTNENDFLKVIKDKIGEEQTDKYKADILKLAKKITKDWIKQKHRDKIQKFLFPTSYCKCAYCERKPNNGGGYLEIEHIIAKTKNRSLVFRFENLLPSCKQCNTVKGKKDSLNILNSYNENSFENHLKLDLDSMVISGLSTEGKATIKILNLSINARDFRLNKKTYNGAVIVRNEIKEEIDKALNIKKKHTENQTIECLFDELKALIEWVDTKKKITSTYATYLFNNKIFKELVDFVKTKDENKNIELNKLIKEKEKCCLSVS